MNPFPELADDPFFRFSEDSEWNACIGPQGNEENYVDGYIEAAAKLANLVIEDELHTSRDTLVLPILYNARHAIELSLKLTIRELHKAGVLRETARGNHDITTHLTKLTGAHIGDFQLREYLERLGPFVRSLAAIDIDGQQLRYAHDQEGKASLGDRPLANLKIIRDSLADLGAVLQQLKIRVRQFCEENSTGTLTPICSRSDLAEIAQELHALQERRGPSYKAVKERLKARFGLGNKTLDDAISVIEANRELGVLLGRTHTLKYLSDANARLVVAKWTILHPPRTDGQRGARIVRSSELAGLMREGPSSAPLAIQLMGVLNVEELADVETVFYLARDGIFPEFYDEMLERTKNEYIVGRDHQGKVQHLLSKTNFLKCFVKGLRKLGNPKLAQELMDVRPDLA